MLVDRGSLGAHCVLLSSELATGDLIIAAASQAIVLRGLVQSL